MISFEEFLIPPYWQEVVSGLPIFRWKTFAERIQQTKAVDHIDEELALDDSPRVRNFSRESMLIEC